VCSTWARTGCRERRADGACHRTGDEQFTYRGETFVKSNPAPPSTALTHAASDAVHIWDDIRLQKLWLAAQRREWRSLAVIGAGKAIDTLPLAELLAQLAWRYRGEPSAVFDLRDLSMRLADYHVREVRSQVDSGRRVIIALRSIFDNPTAGLIAREADAVVVCVGLGRTKLKETDLTIQEIGRERVLGAIIVRRRAVNGTG
jgi:hypothetical protein